MKKLLISLTILFSLFLDVNNVSAKTETSQSSKYLDLYYSFQDDEDHKDFDNFDKAFEEFYSTYKETYPYYVISFYDKGSYALTNIYLFKENPNLQMKVFYDGSFFNYQMGHYLDTFSIDHLYVNWGMTTVQINANKTYEMYKTEFSKIKFYSYSSSLVDQYGYTDWVQNFASLSGSKYYSTKNNIIYYDSNFDITLADNHKYKSNRTNYDVYVDGYYYQPGDIVPSYKSLLKKNYTYNQEIDTTNLSYIRVDFDVSKATYEDYHFSILNNVNSKLKEAYFEKSYEWGICIDENTCYDNYIFRDTINYTESYKMYSISSPFKVEDSEHGFYDETQALNYFYTYYDVSNINDIVTLDIDSTVPFSVSFGNLEDYTDTFVTLNLKNYAGIVLFPKVNLYNGDYNFYLKNANVNVHHYYENNLVNIYKNITVETYRIDQVEYQDRNRYYLIENNVIDIDSYILFDTRYFSYQLVNETFDSITITNPNINKDQKINSIDDSNFIYNSRNENNNIVSFINSIDNSLKYVHNVFSIFFNSLPIIIQGLLIFIFNVLCIFMLLRMGGWLG